MSKVEIITAEQHESLYQRNFERLASFRNPSEKEQSILESRGFGLFDVGEHASVAILLKQPVLENTYGQILYHDFQIIEKWSQEFKKDLPGVEGVILSSKAYAALDTEYFKKTGKLLYTNFYVFSSDRFPTNKTVLGHTYIDLGIVGRSSINASLAIGEWSDSGFSYIGVIPALIFPQVVK